MTNFVQKLVTEASFDAHGVLVPAGHIGTFDKERLNGKEPHIHDVPSDGPVVVEQAAIGPSGPNPTSPQQISPDTVQGPGGNYFRPGVQVVGEVTKDADQRLMGRPEEGDTSEGDMVEALRKAEEKTASIRAAIAAKQAGGVEQPGPTLNNTDDTLVDGTVADIVGKLGEKDDAGLEALRAAEMDREKPRKGVIDAIKAEQAKRTA
jgi:hypothetical protein